MNCPPPPADLPPPPIEEEEEENWSEPEEEEAQSDSEGAKDWVDPASGLPKRALASSLLGAVLNEEISCKNILGSFSHLFNIFHVIIIDTISEYMNFLSSPQVSSMIKPSDFEMAFKGILALKESQSAFLSILSSKAQEEPQQPLALVHDIAILLFMEYRFLPTLREQSISLLIKQFFLGTKLVHQRSR